jgi:hypothetical protein
MAKALKDQIEPGNRVRITQKLWRRDHEDWTTRIEGEVLSVRREPTGSWFAHGRRDKLWLDRVVIRKDDHELSDFVIDERTQIELLSLTAR